MKIYVFAAMILLSGCFAASGAEACSPPAGPIPTAEEVARQMLGNSSTRFVGMVLVTETKTVAEGRSIIRFRVLKQYAGPDLEQLTVIAQENTCGRINMPVGHTMLLDVDLPEDGTFPHYSPGIRLYPEAALEAILDAMVHPSGIQQQE